MSFKSSIGWPKVGANLPTYEGGSPGKAAVRKAEMKVGGMDGIRKAEWTDADGSTYRLNTRNGFPEVISTRKTSSPLSMTLRGFIARVVAGAKAALFSPYTLEVSNDNYKIYEHTYTVLPFATTHNVPSTDETKWNDVLSFHQGVVLVNAKPLPVLGISNAPVKGFIPWIITAAGDGLAKYGTTAENAAIKRVFAIGKYSVHSWFPGVADVSLGGVTYRNDNKAIVCGPRIGRSDNSAHLAQLVYTGPNWDLLSSGWGMFLSTVQMSLTTPYLVGVPDAFSVEGMTVSPIPRGSSPFSLRTTYNPGAAPVSAFGHLYEFTRVQDAAYGTTSYVKFTSQLTDVYYRQPIEDLTLTYRNTDGTTSTYSSTNTVTTPCMSGEITSVASVEKVYQVLGEAVVATVSGQTPAEARVLPLERWEHAIRSERQDSPYYDPEPPPPTAFGEDNVFIEIHGQGQLGFSSGTVNFTRETCAVSATVTLSEFSQPLLRVVASITERNGYEGRLVPFPNPTITPYDDGVVPNVWVTLWAEEFWAYLPGYVQQGLHTEGGALVDAYAAPIAGCPLYTRGRLSGVGYVADNFENNQYSASLSWETRDFILFDNNEGVFVYVLARYTGTQGIGTATATLTVELAIDVRGAETRALLGVFPLSQIELLPQEDMGLGTSLKYLPAPIVRPLFVPLHHEQGGFRGAAYTTLLEHEAGAVPAILFNFVLKLDTYTNIGDDISNDPTTRFIPCNLLEMLYAYVFSSKYGVDSLQRYPVDYIPRYNSFMNTLFTNQWRVNYRNGTLVDWLDTLGGVYVDAQTTEIYRV